MKQLNQRLKWIGRQCDVCTEKSTRLRSLDICPKCGAVFHKRHRVYESICPVCKWSSESKKTADEVDIMLAEVEKQNWAKKKTILICTFVVILCVEVYWAVESLRTKGFGMLPLVIFSFIVHFVAMGFILNKSRIAAGIYGAILGEFALRLGFSVTSTLIIPSAILFVAGWIMCLDVKVDEEGEVEYDSDPNAPDEWDAWDELSHSKYRYAKKKKKRHTKKST